MSTNYRGGEFYEPGIEEDDTALMLLMSEETEEVL